MENVNLDAILQLRNVSVSYSAEKYAVKNVSADVYKGTVTAIMGPSGCGKSTLLRAINRMHELYDINVIGDIFLDGKNIMKMNSIEVRSLVGMVFQRPNPFPTLSIYDNVI
ncbi:MAG: ATP-binding cassette domain-containing protein, partial [Bacteroidales bacterium]|nr:ATP-binding cassette domain-containing protein [Bacteroidales bacterium]